ncbi:hypothetical protein H2O64_21605 [Kordia sp. YSTF-M3]|uniref:Fibronectin type-III domain-containing protein n=1 Tax=Kordia aestuariivivens TaxID=2759037 RepID=A0ABR7QFY1_9FLAO|nr:hypothetical protein [Kordia aestuariivivens]MBC8757281.1 hypothetical protein [Kordia aestuariivivens]
MRKLLYIFVIAIFVSSCTDDEIENNNVAPNPPSLILPSNNSTVLQQYEDQEVFFEWTNATDPDDDIVGYRWYSDTDPNFNNPYHHFTTTNSTTAYFYPNQTYYWKVRTIDSNDNMSNYSQTWSFYLDGYNDPPFEPMLIFPINETECSNSYLTFQWNNVNDPQGDAVTYKLHIDTSPQFDDSPDIYNTFGNNNYTLNLPQGTALYWKVEAFDGQESSFSEVRSLYTQGNGVVNSIPQLQYLSPQDEAVINGNSITLSWIGSDLETSNSNLIYRVYASEIGTSLVLLQESNNIQYTLGNLSSGSDYQWLIYVTDEDGATNVGEIRTFSVQ